MPYESLMREAAQQNIRFYEKKLAPKIKGLYADNVIWINRDLPTVAEKSCVFAEELGHHYTSVGNILSQSRIVNRKQEKRARSWAYEKLVPLSSIVKAHQSGIRNRHELAEMLDVPEYFLDAAIARYREKYGLFVTFENYTIYFEPLGVLEMFE